MSTMEKQRAGPVLPPGRSRRSFTAEFKADAVSLVLDELRSVASVARSLGIGATNLGNWVRQARIDRGEREGVTTSERAELAELRLGIPPNRGDIVYEEALCHTHDAS